MLFKKKVNKSKHITQNTNENPKQKYCLKETHLTEFNVCMTKSLHMTQNSHTLSCTCSLVHEEQENSTRRETCFGTRREFPSVPIEVQVFARVISHWHSFLHTISYDMFVYLTCSTLAFVFRPYSSTHTIR